VFNRPLWDISPDAQRGILLLIGNLIFTDVRDCTNVCDCTTKGEDDSMGKTDN